MPDHPASDPAKPGSKLDSIQKLGRRGGIRTASGRTLEMAGVGRASGGPEPVTGAPVPHTTVKRVTRKAVKRKAVKSVKRAKTVLRKAERLAKAKPKAKSGPPTKVGEPWKAAGVSKAKYYRDKAKGE